MPQFGLPRNVWTPEDETLARELLAQRAPNAVFREKLGRSKNAANSHFYYKSGARPYRDVRRKRELLGDGEVGGTSVVASFRPSDELLAEAKQRADAPRTITMLLCGDPPVGFSALDKRQKVCG